MSDKKQISIQELLYQELAETDYEITSLIKKKKEIKDIWYDNYAWRMS